MAVKKTNFYPLFVFVALLVIFFPAVFFQGKVFLAKMSDMHLVNYSWAAYFQAEASKGRFAFWNPLSFAGYPYGASYMSNVSLLNLFALVFNDVNLAWNAITLSNVFLASVFTYLYVRKIGFQKFAALISGIIFAFAPSSGTSVDSWGFFLPLVLWLWEKYYTSKKIKYIILLFFSFCFLFLSALPQYSFYIGIFFILYTLVRHQEKWGLWILFFSFGACSFYTFRLFELLGHSLRGNLWFVNVLLPTHLITMVYPFFFESPFRPESNFFFSKIFSELIQTLFSTSKIQYISAPFIGVMGFTFLIVSLKEKGVAKFYRYAVLFILVYLMTFPIFAPLYRKLPLLGQMPRIARFGSVLTFCLAVLAGIGIDRFLRTKIKLKPIIAFYVACSVLLIGGLLAFRLVVYLKKDIFKTFLIDYIKTHVAGSERYQAPLDFYLKRVDDFFLFVHQWTNLLDPSIWLPVLLIVLVLLLIHHWQEGRLAKEWFYAGCVILLSADLFIFFRMTLYDISDPVELKTETKLIEFLKQDKDLFRIMPILDDVDYGEERTRHSLSPNLNLLYGLNTVEGYDPLFPGRYSAFFKNFQINYEKDPAMILAGPEGSFDYHMADFLNVKYFVTSKTANLKRDLPVVFEDKNGKIYFNRFYYPRAFLVHDYTVLNDGNSVLSHLKSKAMEFGKTAVLEETPVFGPQSAGHRNKVTFESYGPERIELNVVTRENGILVLTETDYPGWKATVDHVPVKILRANYAFKAIAVPRGEHRIEFIYRPLSFLAGLAVSMISVLGFILVLNCFSKFIRGR